MPGSGTCTFIDPDDYQASLDRTPLDLLLVNDRGEFTGRATSARLHHLYLFRSEEDFPRIAYISLASALVFVGFAARDSRPMVWGGVELQPGEIVLHSRAERFHQRTEGPCGWGLIGLAPAQLKRYSEAVIGKAVGAPPAPRILWPPHATRPGCCASMRKPAGLPRPGQKCWRTQRWRGPWSRTSYTHS